jgi:hypothetical protein
MTHHQGFHGLPAEKIEAKSIACGKLPSHKIKGGTVTGRTKIAAVAGASKSALAAAALRAPVIYDFARRASDTMDMASSLRIEVRDLRGEVLPEFGFNVDDIRSPGDHSALARFMLDRLRDAGRLHAHSVHFIRGSNEVGSWSVDHELGYQTRVISVPATT